MNRAAPVSGVLTAYQRGANGTAWPLARTLAQWRRRGSWRFCRETRGADRGGKWFPSGKGEYERAGSSWSGSDRRGTSCLGDRSTTFLWSDQGWTHEYFINTAGGTASCSVSEVYHPQDVFTFLLTTDFTVKISGMPAGHNLLMLKVFGWKYFQCINVLTSFPSRLKIIVRLKCFKSNFSGTD